MASCIMEGFHGQQNRLVRLPPMHAELNRVVIVEATKALKPPIFFNRFGRQWQVYVQAEGDYRTDAQNLPILCQKQ